MVETAFNSRFDNCEKGRYIKITRRKQAVMANVQNLPYRFAAGLAFLVFEQLDSWQNRVADRLKGLSYPCRANNTRWIAATQGQHTAPPSVWDGRCRDQITRQVNHVLEVVVHAYAVDHELSYFLSIVDIQANRPTNTGVEFRIFGQRHGDYAVLQVCLDD